MIAHPRHWKEVAAMTQVEVLTWTLEPFSRVTLRGAVSMVQRKVAVIHEHVVGASFGSFPMPRTLRLVRWVETTWKIATAPGTCSKRAIRERDEFTCCYCGEYGDTVDHIFPISRGGHVTWLNAVTACQPCNGFKADRTPEEAGMTMLYQPFDPRERTEGEQSRDWADSALVSALAG